MIKFGAVNIDVSHPLSFTWALEKIGRAKYTAVYNDGFRGEDELLAYAKKYDLKICNTLEELAKEVDIVFIHSCNWDKHLDYLAPFIKLNKIVYIDKPLVGNMKDVDKYLEMVKSGAKVIGTSALRYTYEVKNALAKFKELNTRPVQTIVTSGGDGFSYFIHAVEEVLGLHDSEPISVKYFKGSTFGEFETENYVINFKDGTQGQVVCIENRGIFWNTIILTEDNDASTDFCFAVDNAKLYESLMESVCDYFEGKENILIPAEKHVDGIKVLLAGKVSKENDGETVCLDDKRLYNVSYDGNAYYDAYSKKARKIYL